MAHVVFEGFGGWLADAGLEAVFRNTGAVVELTAWNDVKHFRIVGRSAYTEGDKQYFAALFGVA